jgi:hypothetical protein
MSEKVTAMFRLINSQTKPLSLQVVEDFRKLEASPTERVLDPARIRMLREKAEAGQLITFQWSTAQLGEHKYRINGQHSSEMLCGLNGQFPEGLKVHMDEYQVDDRDSLALLFRQFDNRKSGRTPSDVSGAYQGLYPDLHDVPRSAAKIAVEGAAWYDKNIEGLPAPSGDDVYTLFGHTNLHGYICWIGDLFTIKTPELRRVTVVAGMYGTHSKNEAEARKFWAAVVRGGVEYEENHPTTILDSWLRAVAEDPKSRRDLKPAMYYQGVVFAWNAFREGKTPTSIKYDTKKGLLPIHE